MAPDFLDQDYLVDNTTNLFFIIEKEIIHNEKILYEDTIKQKVN